MTDKQTILELRRTSKKFVTPLPLMDRARNLLGSTIAARTVHAVDTVDLQIRKGSIVGLVGESGCGKSTLGRLAVGLHTPSSGQRYWKGQAVDTLQTSGARRELLKMQMIFQDPYSSLNPRLRVQDIIGEAPLAHGLIRRNEKKEYVEELLRKVGLDAAVQRNFPHQFSGGQRARVGIARALAVLPEFIVCDEAVAALDVSIQAQILNLFMQLRDELDLTYLFISHDLGVVHHLSEHIVVMYLGRIVESLPAEALFSGAHHPYTQALLLESPTLEVKKKTFVAIKGEIPSPLNPPSGCHFHPRCPQAFARCRTEAPVLRKIGARHSSACHLD